MQRCKGRCLYHFIHEDKSVNSYLHSFFLVLISRTDKHRPLQSSLRQLFSKSSLYLAQAGLLQAVLSYFGICAAAIPLLLTLKGPPVGP